MFKKLLPYLIIFVGLWYLPEIYNFVTSIPSDISNRSVSKVVYRVDVKIVEPLPILPQKFAVLRTGVPALWIELDGIEKPFIRGGLTGDNGNVTLLDVPAGNYFLRAALKPNKTIYEIEQLQSQNYSVLDDSKLVVTNIDRIEVIEDMNVVSIMRENK